MNELTSDDIEEYLGDPRSATAEKGKALWEAVVSNGVEFIEAMRRFTGAHRD